LDPGWFGLRNWLRLYGRLLLYGLRLYGLRLRLYGLRLYGRLRAPVGFSA
jgi:hypothetical protein